MKRRHFLGAVAAGTVSGALLNAQTTATSASAASAPPATLVRTPIVIMAPRADGCEVVWAVNTLCAGRIEWTGEDGTGGVALADPFGFVPQGGKVLRVRLTGLQPGTAYRLRAITRSTDDERVEQSEWKGFRTLNPRANETHFVVWNDTHINNPSIQALHAATPPADFLLWNGDTCNDWKTEDLLVPTLLHPGQRDISDGRPLFVVWGNHDVRGRHGFEMPGIVATPEGRPFYAFRSGPVAAICLHTGEDKPDSHPSFRGRVAFDALRKEQAAWLAETIRRPEFATAPYRVVFCHIPLRWREEVTPDYGKGGYDWFSGRSRAAWHESLVAWRTQLILSGHTHHHAWLPPTTDFPYGQLVGGGPQPERAAWIEGRADGRELRLRMRDLKGAVLHDVALPPVT